MKSLFLILSILLFTAVSRAEDISRWPQVVMPKGEISAGAKIKVEALPAGESIVATPDANRPLGTAENTRMMKVTAIDSAQTAAADQEDISSLASQGSLRVTSDDLAKSAVCTGPAAIAQTCQVQNAIPLSVSTPTNPNYVYPALAGTTGTAPMITNMAADPSGMQGLIAALSGSLGQANGIGGSSADSSEICDTTTGSPRNSLNMLSRKKNYDGGLPGQDPGTPAQFAKSLGGNPPACGLRQAQEAFLKAREQGKVKNDIMIVNDFSNGAAKGKMWFVNSNGTLADVGVPNPIEVARGYGGFGSAPGRGGTPNGALYTTAYRPPRAGNISDGIELNGLEAENRNTIGRGVLLHGWNPSSVTQGCLGIQGRLTTGRGSRNFGNYLDRLKGGLLKNGGVLIYNFTPKKASGC